jgi:hypothetical protein
MAKRAAIRSAGYPCILDLNKVSQGESSLPSTTCRQMIHSAALKEAGCGGMNL